MNDDWQQRVDAFAGAQIRPPTPGPDPVNAPMIRHWVEAMGDANPIYRDDDAARETGRAGAVAPPAMVQAWTMPGYGRDRSGRADELNALFDEVGCTSVVATDSQLQLHRELVPGDEVSIDEVVEEISPLKRTALGAGHFITTVRTYRDADSGTVATQRWRVLRYAPPPQRAPRPRPAINRDNEFWWQACRQHRLLIQRCVECRELRHPPGPQCPRCGSFDSDEVESVGEGRVFSFVVAHHPKHPAFDYPLVVAVVELAEGTRLISNLVGVDPAEVRVGAAVRLEWLDADPDLSLPVFRPA